MSRESIVMRYKMIPGILRLPLFSCVALLLLLIAGLALPPISIFDPPEHYLPIHTLLEGVSILVSILVFVTAWQMRHDRDAGLLPLLGGAFLAVALLDGMHALSYAGMPDFITPNSPEKAIDFWLAGRFIAIASLLALLPGLTIPSQQQRSLYTSLSLAAGLVISAIVFYVVIYHAASLPRTYIEDGGLTPFKIHSEYFLIFLGLIAALLLARQAYRHRDATSAWLATAALAFAFAELFFTLYGSVTDLMNLMGHLFKTFGSATIYLAFFSRLGHQPWWNISSRIRLFISLLAGIFVAEYLIMMALPMLMRSDRHQVLEATIDASVMSVVATTLIMLLLNRFQSRAMRAEYALDHTHDGYCVIDEEGHLTDANSSFCRMFGYRLQTALNFDIFAFEASSLPQEKRIDLSLIMEQGYANILTQFKDRDDKLIDLDISATYLPAVRSIVLFLQDITTLKSIEQQVDNLAFYDQLTQLPNRQLMMGKITTTMSKSEQSGQFCALLCINIDNFKQLNHAKGSEIGDEFLGATAGQLLSAIDEEDVVARLGGDEFVIMLTKLGERADHALSESQKVADRVRRAIATPVSLGSHGEVPYQGSACIGITLFRGQRETPEALLRQATIAVHQAKSGDRNSIRFYSGEMQRIVNEQVELTEAMRAAIDKGEFELFYQPQTDRHGHIVGAEALLRWQHPVRGQISPAQFIPLAEETGLILPLGRWVLQSACRQLREWLDTFDNGGFSLSINISAAQIRHRGFVNRIQQELEESGIPPSRLKLELTESILVENVQQATQLMSKLTELGIRFSLDDFGTGYSSLSYLTSLPLSQLKIDRSFVQDLNTNRNHQAVVRTIINMGEALKLEIVAEGVETEDELDTLEKKGCHIHQGYLFSKPLPADAFTKLLKTGKTDWPAES